MKLIEDTYFIESANVKVFPCSYRGFDESGNIYDPEASGFTEYNFANIYGKQTKLISWSGGLLKCIIDGYYFEIKNITPDNLCINNILHKFVIVLKSINIVGSYQTKVLESINGDNENYLDPKIDGINYFTGLALIPETKYIGGAAYFSPCKLVTNENGTSTAVINWQSYRLTDALTTGGGDGAVAMLGTVKNDKSTVCYATGENAFALGNGTAAGGNFSIAGGTKSTTSHENSVAVGNNVNTSADNQVVLGAYNKENENAALIIGNGPDSDNKKNILEVSKNGDINAAGKLDVAGNISSSKGGITLKENGFIDITHNYKEPGSDEVKTRSSLLKENGDLEIDGDVKFNETLTVEKQTEIKGNITGRGNFTINGAGSTHELIIGSQDGTGDYGSITVYGKKLADGQETKIKVFSVDNEGAATIAKTLTVGNKLVVNDDEGVSINNKKVTIANPTTINNTLAVNGALGITGATTITDTITDNNNVVNVVTTINKDKFDYNGKFTVDTAGNITNANSLSLTKGGIDANGKITGESLEVSGASIGTTGKVELIDGLSIFKTEVPNSDPKTYKAIKFSKESIENIKDNDSAGKFNHKDALVITNEFTDNTAATSNQASGLHVAGMLTAAGNVAIFESDNANKYITTKITQGGTAYFKQGLLVGGTVTGANESDDTVTFRVAPFSSDDASNTSYATLKGDLNIKKYKNNTGNLKVEGHADISGDLTIGAAGGGIKFTSNTTGINITGIQKIQAKTFDAISDIRKKTAIQDYRCKKSILDLPIKEFEFIDDETHAKNIGCIAQDLQEICPEIVHEDKDGYLSIEETKLVYLLLQEVKELKKEIKALKGE